MRVDYEKDAMNDDAALVELAKSGDQEAFAALYERYFDGVYDFLARMVRDSSEAADLTQDAFLRAMNSLHTLTKGTSFKSWLFTIARNTALNRLERASRMQPLEGTNDAGEEQSYDVIDTDRFGNPEEAAEASSLASVVWEAAAALDPKYRSVLLLNLREGLDSAEIADVMGVTKNHAYVLVNRMKSALQSSVEALALFRNGRRHCAELDAVIARLQVGELSPEARRVIERHAGNCEVCQEQRRKLASPFAIFAGMTLVQPGAGVKEAILGGLQEAFGALTPAGANAGGGITDMASGQGDLSGNQLPGQAYDGTLGHGGGFPFGSAGPGAAADDGDGFWSKPRIAVLGAVAAILVVITAPIAALSFFGGGDEAIELAVVQETPAPTATDAPTLTATATVTEVVLAIIETETETPTPDPGTPVPIEEDNDAGLAGGGDPPTQTPTTPVPILEGPNDPGIGTPPSVTPDPNGPPGNPGVDVLPPAPDPDPPETCAYSMTASTGELVYDGSSRSQTFVLTGEGCGAPLDVTLEPGSSWIVAAPASGSIPIGGSLSITVFVDLEDRTSNSGRVRVTSKAGSFDILITIEPPPRGQPGDIDEGDGGRGEDDDNTPPCSSVNCPPPPPGGPGGFTN